MSEETQAPAAPALEVNPAILTLDQKFGAFRQALDLLQSMALNALESAKRIQIEKILVAVNNSLAAENGRT